MLVNSIVAMRTATLAGLLAASCATAATAQPKAAVPTLRYTLSMPAPQTHYFDVKMEMGGFPADYTDVKMPVWAPGSYLVREFAKNVEGFEARSASGQLLAAEKINKNTWRVKHPKQASFRVSYRVYAFELSVRTSFIDADHGYLNGSSVFMYPADNKMLPSTVAVQPAAGWSQVSTALRPAPGKFTYQAASYDELADSPIEIGNQKILEFTANGTKHLMAMYGTYTVDEAKLLADMKRVCEAAQGVVGQNPLDHYLFIVHNLERGSGGLEHLYSTTLEVSRTVYNTDATFRNSFLGLAAHEYFHLWNVKRIRPVALGPFNYDQENYTHMLWVSEGMTEYYSKVILQRAGIISREEYLGKLGNEITEVESTPGNRVQSAAESSFDAWIKSYRPNENSSNTQISYYPKGDLIGTWLDLNIIEATQGKKHLDDVFRLLYDTYYLKAKRGFTDQEYQDAVATVAGRRFDSFFQKSVYGTAPIDFATALGYAGLTLTSTRATNGTLGATFSNRTGKLLVTSVVRDGVAWNTGLNVNDEILQINGAAPSEETTKALTDSPTGTEVKLQVRRDGLPRDLTLKALPNPDVKFTIQPVASPTPAQQAVLARWLK